MFGLNLRKSIKERLFTFLLYLSLIFGCLYCYVGNEWYWLIYSVLLAIFHGILGGNIALHRFYSHRQFVTTKIKEYFLLIESILSGHSIGPITWVAVHRAHHANADNIADPHSPNIYNPIVIGLGLHYFISDKKRKDSNIKLPIDLMRNKNLRFVEKYYHHIWLCLSLVVYLIFGFNILLYCLLMPAAINNIYPNLFLNFLSHYPNVPLSYRNYDTNDKSTNNKILSLLTFGECFHNNHHYNQRTYNNAHKKGELDLTYYVIKYFFAKDDLLTQKNTIQET